MATIVSIESRRNEGYLTQEEACLTFLGSLMNRGVELRPSDYNLVSQLALEMAGAEAEYIEEQTLELAA